MLIPSPGSETFPIQAGGQTKQVTCFCHHHASYKTIVAAVTIPNALFGTVGCLTELVPEQDEHRALQESFSPWGRVDHFN